MTSVNTNSDKVFRVIVSAIVGGPFDLKQDETVTEKDINGWKEELLRLGAIEPVEQHN